MRHQADEPQSVIIFPATTMYPSRSIGLFRKRSGTYPVNWICLRTALSANTTGGMALSSWPGFWYHGRFFHQRQCRSSPAPFTSSSSHASSRPAKGPLEAGRSRRHVLSASFRAFDPAVFPCAGVVSGMGSRVAFTFAPTKLTRDAQIADVDTVRSAESFLRSSHELVLATGIVG
jgi:hypothetical protein